MAKDLKTHRKKTPPVILLGIICFHKYVNDNNFLLSTIWYNYVQEFEHQASMLVQDSELSKRLVTNGKSFVRQHHDLEIEKKTYQHVVSKLLSS